MFIAKNLSITVNNQSILKDVNFQSEKGHFTSIIGPNGAGKSSLLKALCADMQPSSGSIEFDGKPLSNWSSKTLAKQRAVLTQNYDCEFPFKAKEIVDMSHFVHQDEESLQSLTHYSNEAMRLLGVSHLANASFNALSGGEKQRVQLARVLCQLLPSIEKGLNTALLIDEPTSSLDLYHQYHVMKTAHALCKKGCSVIAVVHDLALAASFADTIYLLDEGRIERSGKPNDVLSANQLQKTYAIHAQLSKEENTLPFLKIHQD